MKVCIAEKPSVAKEIARILNANVRKDGYFEGNGYQVTWTFGHLCTLKNPEDYLPEWKQWRMHALPMIPPRFGIKLIDNDGVQKQFNTIKRLVSECDEVINCGDAGIEGELIQRWVLTKAECAKPLKRLWISSMTDEAIKEGFDKLREGKEFDRLYLAGNARAIGDWLLGMNASRLYTLKYADGKGVLSIGRVQTPTLALIVRRFEEIRSFVSKPFWEIKTNYRGVIFNSTSGRFDTAEEATKVIEEIKTNLFEVTSFEQKKGNEAPPKLFDLTALQVECNRKFGYTAEDTLKYIQTLYEKKMVTYPRVDTTFLPTDMYPKIQGILKNMEPYANFTAPLLEKPIKKSKKVFDDAKITDHHAIIPTGVKPSGLIYEEKKVYDLIARRFIAAFYPDCVVSNTTVMGKVATHEFKATGKVILEDGWRALYPKKDNDPETDAGEDQIMPHFEKGEMGEHIPDLLEKQTQPPKMLTEATLLRAMETAGKQVEDEELRELMKENGIGRPSTRANIIETLFKRKFIVREKKNLVPTQTGIQLINTIQNELLKSAELTGIWEKKLREIEKGEYDPRGFLDEMKKMVADLVNEVKRESRKVIVIEQDVKSDVAKPDEKKPEDEKTGKEKKNRSAEAKKPAKKSAAQDEASPVITCPKCGKGTMLKGKTAFGCSEYKNGCAFKVLFEQYGKVLSDKQIYTLVQKRKSPKIKGLVVDGETIDVALVFDPSFNVVPETKKETTEKPKGPSLF
ncbi:MAG TPA: DNA topoisomerase 3 [Bacteroidales bacterium]|nr:DNA topoisomerase 3 [Bacteroidales bacterium]